MRKSMRQLSKSSDKLIIQSVSYLKSQINAYNRSYAVSKNDAEGEK